MTVGLRRRRATIGMPREDHAAVDDWARWFRARAFGRVVLVRVLVLGFAVVATVSEHWLEPRAPGTMFPGVARAGLWRACAHYASSSPVRDRSSIARWWREVERSFRGIHGLDQFPPECVGAEALYGDVYETNYWPSITGTRAAAIGFIFASILELTVLVFYFLRRRRVSKGGFATASSVSYSILAWVCAVAACVVYATLVRDIRKNTPAYVKNGNAVFTDWLGWGFWMFLACAATHTLMLACSIRDWDAASRARFAERMDRSDNAER